jgi:hypothetical protein
MELGRTCDFKRATARKSTYYGAVSYADGVNQQGGDFLDAKLAVVAQERVSMTADPISEGIKYNLGLALYFCMSSMPSRDPYVPIFEAAELDEKAEGLPATLCSCYFSTGLYILVHALSY